MKDMRKTKAQLVEELAGLRARVAGLEAGGVEHPRPDRRLLAGLVDEMLEPTVMLDFAGNLLHGNALAAEILGLEDAAEIPGMSLATVMHPDSLQQAAVDLEAVKQATAPFLGSYKLLIDGRTVHIESHGHRIDLVDGEVDLVSFRDVSGRRERIEELKQREAELKKISEGYLRTERELQRSEQLFRAMVENANDIIYMISTDGSFQYVSPNWTSLLGHEPDEVIGTSFTRYVHPDDLPACLEFLQLVLESGGRHGGMEYRVQHKDGSWRWHVSNASAMNTPEGEKIFTGIARDVTPHKQADEALRESEALLKSVLDNSSTVIFIKDVEGKYLLINKRYEELFGVANQEIVGKTDFDIFPPDAAEQFQAKDRRAIEADGPIAEEEHVPHEDGIHTYISVKFPLKNTAGEPFATCGISTDITERKRTEEELAQLNRNLEYILGATNTGLDIIDADFNLRYVSPSWQKRYGDPAGKKCFQYYRDEDAVCEGCGVPQALATKQPVVTELALPKEEDRPIQVTTIPFQDDDGEWLAAEVKVDITERKRAELQLKEAHDQLEKRVGERTAELEQSEKMFRALTESTKAMVVIASLEDERAIYANPAATAVTGYSFEELTAHPAPVLFTEESMRETLRLREAYQQGEPLPDRMEMEILTRDGERRWVESAVALIEVGDAGMHKVVTSFDITDRKRAEEALKESEKKFRVLADSTTASIAIVAGEPPRFVYANQTALDRYGVTWEQLAELDPAESLTPAAREAGTRAGVEALERGDTQYRFEYQDEDGRWSEVNVAKTEVDGQEAAIYTAFDITEHKRAQLATEESEKKFRRLAESTAAHITILQDDRYVYANQAFLEYYDVEADDLPVLNPDDLMLGIMDPDTIQRAGAAWQEAQERGDKHFTFEYPDTEGNWFQANVTEMELDGRPAYLAMTIDITELKRAQQAIAENEEKYRTIFDTAGTGMISFGDDAVITMANDEWCELSGYSKQETIGKLTWMPFFSEKSLEMMKRYHQRRSADPSSVPQAYEAQFVDRSGGLHDGIVNIQLIPGTHQRVASFQDMTELKRAQNEMYRADKMAALGQIIAGVAHEINNPNNFIYFNLPILRRYVEAMSPLLESHLADDPDLKILNMPYQEFLADVYKLLENMEHGSKRITGIVSELKNYIRSDEEQTKQVEPLAAVIERVMALVGKQVRKMVKRFDVDVGEDLPPIKMNPGKIEQVLINLVINAGQAANKEDSWVELTARPAADPGFVELLVEDNGAGIPEENLDQIFEPFFTSKSREAGTGLGLSISHRIIEEHGGTISVVSTLGEGTLFRIRLPAVHGD